MDEIKNVDDYVNDAKTKEIHDGDDNGNTKRGKRDYYIELALFLILGILLGVAIKTEAVKKVTIGFNDYKMKIMNQDFDINKLEKDALAKQMEAAKQDQANGAAQNPGDNTSGTDSNVPAQDNAQNNTPSDNNSQNQ
ncbi:MAG: hypothetical protein WCV59_05185 [Parcubacteria group bacterium]|jgi:hypothetical protein